MKCTVALNRILEADPLELQAGAPTQLARHIAECERCSAVADALLVEMDRLDEDLGAWARSADSDALVAAVLGAGAWQPDHTQETGGGPGAQRRRSPWARYAWIPLAAAAAVAGVLLAPRPEPEPGPEVTVGTSRDQPAVAVRPPADQGTVVMKTNNPDITIVWLYQREET